MKEFLALSDTDLQSVLQALQAGRLSPPFTALGLQKYCSPSAAAKVATRFQALSEQGLRSEHLSGFLEAIAADRAARAGAADQIDLVWTGPEAPGSVLRDTGVVVRELFSSARQSVLVAGYAVYQGSEVFRELANNMDRNPSLQVRMFLNVSRGQSDTSVDVEVLQRFAARFKTSEWPGKRFPEVFYDPRSLAMEPRLRASLHAKCVVVDRTDAFISSANFTEAAQFKNIELGVVIKSPRLAMRVSEHFESLIRGGNLLPIPGLQ